MAQRKTFNFGAAEKILSKEKQADVEEKFEESPKEKGAASSSLVSAIEKVEKASGTMAKAFNFKFVPREKLVFHKKNDYPMEAIQQIADTILEFGLIHNLEVMYGEENDKYIIESGEQRTRAIDYLIDKYKDSQEKETSDYQKYLRNVHQFYVEGYPCNVKMPAKHEEELSPKERELEEVISEIRLTLANEIGRGNNEERKKEKVLKLNELITKRNELTGKQGKANVNKEIAETLGITNRQVIKYKAISKLIPELQEMFDKNNISINEGENYSKLDENEQRQILELIESGKNKEEINALYEKLKQMRHEIDDKKKEIAALETDKMNALDEVKKVKKETARIEEEIRLQVESEMEQKNIAEMNRLQEELKQANLKLNVSKNKLEVLEDSHQKKVEELERKLQEREEQVAHPQDVEFLRISLQIEDKLKTAKMAVEQLKQTYAEYERLYGKELRKREKSPEVYEKEIKEMLKWESGGVDFEN